MGLELALKTAQEWETNAASHVSLHVSLTDITKLIIRWRRLELETWPQMLEQKKRGTNNMIYIIHNAFNLTTYTLQC